MLLREFIRSWLLFHFAKGVGQDTYPSLGRHSDISDHPRWVVAESEETEAWLLKCLSGVLARQCPLDDGMKLNER